MRAAKVKLWSVIGALAGIVGAAAGVYPLIFKEQTFVLLSSEDVIEFVVDEKGQVGQPTGAKRMFSVSVQPLSDSILVTGGARVSLENLTYDIFRGHDLKFGTDTGQFNKDVHIEAGKRKLLLGEVWPIRLTVSEDRLRCFQTCPTPSGLLRIEVEFKSRNGVGHAKTDIPFCLNRGPMLNWHYGSGCS